jgi:spore germination protein
MEIYIVQQGDTIASIAERFGVNPERLATDNGLSNPEQLAVGQTIVIAYPKQTHMVQQGDTLQSIAEAYNTSVLQLLKNNPELSNREFIYPGEQLVISYDTNGDITTTGFAFPFITQEILIKTLPSLTYLAVFNYRISNEGEIFTFHDDTRIISTAKEYGTVPILLISVLTMQGEPDVETAYKLLINEEVQAKAINAFVTIIKDKGYGGANIVFNITNEENQSLYANFIKNIYERILQENLLFFVSFNYSEDFAQYHIDYSKFIMYTNAITFIQLKWGANYDPPAPVSNIDTTNKLISNVLSTVTPEKIVVGNSTIGYDWPLPYVQGRTVATSLSINSAFELAYDTNSTIQFDDTSQTPYFIYFHTNISFPTQHIVWFIDARSVNVLLDLIDRNELNGNCIWNIMTYYHQLWLLINSQYNVIKIT